MVDGMGDKTKSLVVDGEVDEVKSFIVEGMLDKTKSLVVDGMVDEVKSLVSDGMVNVEVCCVSTQPGLLIGCKTNLFLEKSCTEIASLYPHVKHELFRKRWIVVGDENKAASL